MALARNLAALGGGSSPRWLTEDTVETIQSLEPAPFPAEEYGHRMRRVRDRLTELNADALIVFRPSSIEYLSGYHTQETAPQPLLVTHDSTYLYVMDLEVGRALASSSAKNILFTSYANTRSGTELITDHVLGVLPDRARLAIEFGNTSTPPRLIDLFRARGLSLVDGQYLVENLKLVLSPAELRYMDEAARVTKLGVDAAAEAAALSGATDSTVAAAIAEALHREANSVSAWGPLVVTAPRSGVPHSTFKGEPIGAGPTFVEFAGTCHRYHTPVMRTLVSGRPSEVTLRLADRAKTALAAVLETAKAGTACAEVANAGLAALGTLADDEVFHHMFGYPVGLAHPPHWMDSGPFCITADNPEPLRAGMTFHVPASFRSFGAQCVGLSQTFVVEETGTRVLTHGDAELLEV